MILLAEAMTAPVQIAAWLSCLFFVVAMWNQLSKAFDRMKGKPAAEQLQQISDQMAERISKLEDSRESDLRELRGEISGLIAAGEKRAIDLHNRLNPVTENTAFIKGSMEAFTQSFNNFTHALLTIKDNKR